MQNNVQMNKEIWLTNSVKNDLITEESIYVFIFIFILDFSNFSTRKSFIFFSLHNSLRKFCVVDCDNNISCKYIFSSASHF